MHQLCVFDFDGTLADTIADIAAAVNRALARMGYAQHPLAAYDRMVGSGADTLCVRALPEGEKARAAELLALYKADYFEHCTERTRAYGGVAGALQSLADAGCALAVITNKPQEQVERVLAACLGGTRFVRIVGQLPGVPKKPLPDTLLALMQACGYEKDETVYVGDSDVDMQFANAAGVAGIGASWGFRGRAELEAAGAGYVADDPADMARYILARRGAKQKELAALARTAAALGAASVRWAVGGSLLLWRRGIAADFHDIDLLVDERDIEAAAAALGAIGTLTNDRRSAPYTTRHFLEYVVGGADVDVMAGFGVMLDGVQRDFAFGEAHVARTEPVEGTPVCFGFVEDWYILYQLIPGREAKVRMAEDYLARPGRLDRAALLRALENSLPDDIRRRSLALLASAARA
ncbi:MAG: HAD hydrolase-like protein [Oscillospiraceae bacterium]|nr:HAD hydrolase-like protein [Oscillospiraceae bacterium]